jgi:hypothetical protein
MTIEIQKLKREKEKKGQLKVLSYSFIIIIYIF